MPTSCVSLREPRVQGPAPALASACSLAGPEGALGFHVLFLVPEPQRAPWLFADSPHFR